MQEKRKNVRLPIKLKLEVSNLFKQDGVKIENLDTEIEVFDISKAGIGFMSLSKLPVNYYFNATIEFENREEVILSVVKILYVTPIGNAGYTMAVSLSVCLPCMIISLKSMHRICSF